MDESRKNRIILVIVIVIMLMVITFMGVYLHFNKEEEGKSSFKLKQIYVSDHKIIKYDKYYLGINGNRIISVVDDNGKELYLSDTGVKYDGLFKKDDDTPIIYNILNNKLNVYKITNEGPVKLFTINDVSEVIPLIYQDDKSYLMGFIQYKDNDTYIYNFENNGLIVLDGISLVGDIIKDNLIYTYNKDNIIVEKDDIYGSVDINGKEVLEIKYTDLMNDENNILFSLKNKYGIMNKKKEVILEPKYDIVKSVSDGYLIGSNKLSFYDRNMKKLINKGIRHNVTNYSLREDRTLYGYRIDNTYVIVNNYLEDSLDKKYKNHDMYIINNNKIKKVEEIGFNNKNEIYSYNKDKIVIYNEKLEKELDIKNNNTKINDIIKVQNNYYYIKTDKKNYLYNKEGNKIINKWGKLVFYNSKFLTYSKNKTIKFINYHNEVLESLEGNDIIIDDNSIVVDGTIYLIEYK